MPLLVATPGEGTMLVGVFETDCATARPGPVTAAANASANSFLFIENVSSSFDFKAANPRRPLNPEQGLLQFCQCSLAASITNVTFYPRTRMDCCISATHTRISACNPIVTERGARVPRPGPARG